MTKAKGKIVTVEIDGKPEQIEVRQVSMLTRDRLRRIATNASDKEASLNADIAAVIAACYDPVNDKPRWEKAHADMLKNEPAGGYIDVLARQAALLMRGPVSARCKLALLDEEKRKGRL